MINPVCTQVRQKGAWMAHKASFLKHGTYMVVAIIRLSYKWASVSRFLYSDLMYTMHENVASHTYVDPNWTRAFVASFFKHAYFFGAFNQKVAKLESLNWIFCFSSACNSELWSRVGSILNLRSRSRRKF